MSLSDLYGFKPVEGTVIERVFDLDFNLLSYMFLLERKDYFMPIYVKFDKNLEIIKEVYPLLLRGDINFSLKVFKNEETFNPSSLEGLDYLLRKYSYFSWDLNNEPSQVYFIKNDKIRRFGNDEGDSLKLEMECSRIVGLKNIEKCPYLSYKIKDFLRKEKADYIYTYFQDGHLCKFIVGINNKSERYSELFNIVSKTFPEEINIKSEVN